MSLEHQISIYEYFLKDNVTMKSGVKAAGNHRNELHIKIYKNRKELF